MVSTSLMVDTITVPSRRCLLCAGKLALTIVPSGLSIRTNAPVVPSRAVAAR